MDQERESQPAVSASPAPAPAGAASAAPSPPQHADESTIAGALKRYRWPIIAVGLIVALVKIVPMAMTAWRTVSTDDAYVNGHVTFVAPRVAGQVVRVLVDDNNRVHKGDLLVQLDKEPYQVQVEHRPGGGRGRTRPISSPPRRSTRGLVGEARSHAVRSGARHRGRRQPGRLAARQGRHAAIAEGDRRKRPKPTTTAARRSSRAAPCPGRSSTPQGSAFGGAGTVSRRRGKTSTRFAPGSDFRATRGRR